MNQSIGDNIILGMIKKGRCRFIFLFRRIVANLARMGQYIASRTPEGASILSDIIGAPSKNPIFTSIRGVKWHMTVSIKSIDRRFNTGGGISSTSR